MSGVAAPRWKSVARSLRIYHGDKPRNAAMDRLHARFLKAGDLAFDIGSHVGDRISSFRRLGARVVALEPQPLLARVIRLIHGRDPCVALVAAACGARGAIMTMKINAANPTVSTLSTDFVAAAAGAPGWESQSWNEEILVPVTTLDSLIARHGVPRFVKIDVEGFEADALAGLSRSVPALSFEFTTIQRDVAYECLDRLAALGFRRYNLALGESQALREEFVDAGEMKRIIADLPHAANSGDVYAVSR